MLCRHGAGGEALLRSPAAGDGPLELLVIDRGPGIADVAKALEDGYSTAGTPGTGLGAVVRMSDLFDLYSTPSVGTVLYARSCRDGSLSHRTEVRHDSPTGWRLVTCACRYGMRSSAATRGRRDGMATPTW